MDRPEQPEPFLRGCAFPPGDGAPYPRADPSALGERLPRDTWQAARLPVGVRFELVGDAEELEVEYQTATRDLGHRGTGAGTRFSAWRGDRALGECEAVLGRGRARLPLEAGDEPVTVYLPEGMRPTVLYLRGLGGAIEPAPMRPRWLCYGDSIAEGWLASGPAHAWPAVVGRRQRLDVVNLGYAGAARGEIVTAEQMADLPTDVISIAHGTNCWSRTPASTALFRAGLEAFLEVLREKHPATPILAVSPILRPDAEQTPNRLGATLAALRRTFEEVVEARRASGDAALRLLSGRNLLDAERLPDGVHPDDAGHARLAAGIGPHLEFT